MKQITVPERFRPALLGLATLSDAAVTELRGVLEKRPEVLLGRDAAFEAAGSLRSLKQSDAFAILEALIPLLYMASASGQPTKKLIADLSRSLRQSGDEAKRLPEDKRPILETRLAALLDVPALGLRSKAIALSVESQRVFDSVKIYTDIRPVFGVEGLEMPQAAIILHNLKLEYVESNEEREFFLTLDSKELKEFAEAISRAVKKEELLRPLLAKTSMNLIDTVDTEGE